MVVFRAAVPFPVRTLSKAVAVLVLIGLTMAGCTSPGASSVAPLPASASTPEPVGALTAILPGWSPGAGVVQRSDGWQVPAIKGASLWYAWSPDRRWIAFQSEAGLWAVSPDGGTEHLLQAGDRSRQLAGWWEGSLVFVDYGPGGGDDSAAIRAARPGEAARTIAELKVPIPSLGLGTALSGPYLGIWQDSRRPLRLDLRTGALKEIGAEPMPAHSAPPLLSPSGHYALVKNLSEWDRLRMYDLQEGTSLRSEEAVYPYSPVWAPLDDRWAAIAGPPGNGSADGGAFGTALDVGDPGLNVTHLQPPVPLKLRGGPWWSADGQQLAVTAEVRSPSDSRYRDALNEVWVVTIVTNAWRKQAQVQFVHVQGWHPSDDHLVVWEIISSVGAWRMGRMDIKDGRIEWLPVRSPKEWDTTRVDEHLWVVGTPGGWDQPAAYLERPGNPPLPLSIAQQFRKDGLQFRPPYVSWVEYGHQSPAPGLVVVRRPGETIGQ